MLTVTKFQQPASEYPLTLQTVEKAFFKLHFKLWCKILKEKKFELKIAEAIVSTPKSVAWHKNYFTQEDATSRLRIQIENIKRTK